MRYTLTIPKRITHGEELLVVRRREYEQLQKHLAEVKDALAKIRRGEKELKEGKTHVIKSLAEKKEKWFRQDAFDLRLHTHKLKGELEVYWAYSVNYKYRILFRFLKSDEVIYYDIGTHDIYN